jgi:hypothetical protein
MGYCGAHGTRPRWVDFCSDYEEDRNMTTIRTYAALTLAGLLGAASFAPAVNAQANCPTYGKLALQQQKKNEALKCGFSGPDWSSDFKAHIAWCNSVGPDKWKAKLTERTQKLAACKAK